ncbi:MAG: hypothetical protein JWO17_325 [Actinomycetia bacterium]|nr:hypothetical protein [Actinomycetes bacterium]
MAAAVAMVAMVAVGAGCGSTRSGNHTAATPGTAGSGVKSTSTTRAKAVKFAECMRANGVSAFPDPDASGALTIDAVANGSSLDTSSAAFKRALSACKDLEPSGFTGNQRSPQEQKAALEFAQCIRDNGARDFPDPAKTDPLVDTNRMPSAATPGGMTILNAAMRKCGQYASAAGVRGSK